MAWLFDLLKEVEDSIYNKQYAFQNICYRIVVRIEERSAKMDGRQDEKGKGEGEDDDPEGLAGDQRVDKIRQQAIFDDVEQIEIKIRRGSIYLVIIAVNQLSSYTIPGINKNYP